MRDVSSSSLILRRLVEDWALLLSAFIGVLIAAVLVAGAPVYLGALDRLAFHRELDQKVGEHLGINVFASRVPLTGAGIQANEDALNDAVDGHIAEVLTSQERYLKTGLFLVGLPGAPLPELRRSTRIVSRGYFQTLTNLEPNARFLKGRIATDVVGTGEEGPMIEAVVSEPTALDFGLAVGSVVTLAPTTAHPTRISVEIVGILEPDDPTSEFWRYPSVFLDPGAVLEQPDPGVRVREEPPVALFVTEDVLADVVAETYPGSLADPFWFILAGTDRLKKWSISETQSRLEGFEDALAKSMPGADVLTGGFTRVVEELNRKSFINRLPLLVLLTIMVATVLFYLAMTVSYLVQKREGDLALLRTRGVGTLQLLRLYGLEATVLTIVAVIVAPFLALGAVAMAGKLPYFSQSTGGAMLPVDLTPTPFLAALGAGLLSLAILLIPGLLGARSGLAVHKLRSSRPPTVPFFHRYYLDVGLLVLGGLIFWELNARGQIVSGGLFKDVQVNETLLLAPVLFLVVVALVFVRFFPLIVRFVSGDSAALVHLLTAAALVVLVPVVAVQEARDEGAWSAVVQVAPLLALGVLYWATTGLRRPTVRLALTVLQAGAVAAFVYQRPPESEQVLFIPTLALMAVVPAQVGFMLLRALARTAPVWLSVGLWRMARNPLQYTWLVVLLLLATGLGILSTTVGGTLDRSQRDRIQYDVAADVRISDISGSSRSNPSIIKRELLEDSGVAAAAIAYRDSGNFGSVGFGLLGVEAAEFAQISWYRDDFSPIALKEVMAKLQSPTVVGPVSIPEDATHVGLWARPAESYIELFVWAVLGDGSGRLRTVSLGQLGAPEWQMLDIEIPSGLEHPRRLVSVQVFEPAGRLMSLGSLASQVKGSPGTVHFDDIFASGSSENGRVVLEDFEGALEWGAIVTGAPEPDRISIAGDAFRGQASATFSFGVDRNRVVRGFYRSPTGGTVLAVVSRSFLEAGGLSRGDVFVARTANRLIPFSVQGTVEYFPTLSPESGGFVIADLDALMFHVNLVSEQTQVVPNELYVKSLTGAEDETLEAAQRLATGFGSVQGTHELLDSFENDPLAGVGLRALVLIALGVVVIALGLGYVTFLLSSEGGRIAEAGFLQAIGISRLQMLSLLGVENVSVFLAGIAVGTWAGLEMSSLMVSALSMTEEGAVLPPAIITTDWVPLSIAFGVLVAVVAASLFTLNRAMLRLNLQAVSRLAD